MLRGAHLLVTGALALALGSPAGAITPFVETDDVLFRLNIDFHALVGGLVPGVEAGDADGIRTAVTQLQQIGADLGGLDTQVLSMLDNPEIGLHSSMLRFAWRLALFDVATLDVHNRFQMTLTSAALESTVAGLGVSAAPSRTVDLRSMIVDRPGWTLEHDLDRLALGLFFGPVDITLGRQAITWGHSNLFPIADLWANFSPFELDTTQKRGVDGLRVGAAVSDMVELDFVLADRGTLEDLSGGARATFYLPGVDLYVALAKHWNELVTFLGASAAVDAFKIRGEAALPVDLDAMEVLYPRVTLGFDWLHSDVNITAEVHYNGTGAEPGDDYQTHLAGSAPHARGETYLYGQWYAGAAVGWRPVERLALNVSGMVNLQDPSALLTLMIAYELAQDVEIALMTLHGLGAALDLTPVALGQPPEMESEFGLIGHMALLDIRTYF